VLRLLEQWYCIPDDDDQFIPWESRVVFYKVFLLEIEGVQYESIEDPSERSLVMADCDENQILVKLPLRTVTMPKIGIVEQLNPIQKVTTWNLYWRDT
jgi:hypothetical protein